MQRILLVSLDTSVRTCCGDLDLLANMRRSVLGVRRLSFNLKPSICVSFQEPERKRVVDRYLGGRWRERSQDRTDRTGNATLQHFLDSECYLVHCHWV